MNKKSALPPKKKLGRPRGAASNGAEAHESGLNRMLERLLDENLWLREKAESEGQIATHAGIPKSTVREAVIALVRIGCLKRNADGLIRNTLPADRLIKLYSLRLRFELLAMSEIFHMDEVKRQVIATNVDAIRRQQLAAVRDHPPGSSNFMRWLHAGMDFHTAIVRSADMRDEANFMKNLLVQVRVGSFKKVDESSGREEAVKQHETYVRFIQEGKVLADQPRLIWHEFVAGHLKESFKAAMRIDNSPVDAYEELRINRMWDAIVKRARGDAANDLRLPSDDFSPRS